MKLIVFGGTFEGRELARWAVENGFSVILCVATDYGEMVCEPGYGLEILTGRMDSDEMSTLFEKEQPEMIVDATHPHAVLVSENIRAAAEREEIGLIRVIRPGAAPILEERYSAWEKESVYYVSGPEEAVEYLKKDDAPVLLTTGSKELSEFLSVPGASERLYVRVLPQGSAISACEKAGISGRHIIAMQGPFSRELNLALINSIKAGWLVTKESGESGGYPEKIEAAAESGIRVVVIRRPVKEEGLNLNEAKAELLKVRDAASGKEGGISDKAPGAADITLIGLGMGGGSQLTLEAVYALKGASVVFGAERMLKDIRSFAIDTPLVALYKHEDILSWLESHPEVKKACVVFSGDTGFYSGSASFIRRMKDGRNLHILPGISSFSCLCARFGLREEEFTPASAHGKDADVVSLLLDRGKIFLLLDTQTTIGSVCRTVTDAGYPDTEIYAGIRLGYPDEELLRGRAADLTGRDKDPLAVMALVREGI